MINPMNLTLDDALELADITKEQASHNCHAVSLALINHPEFPTARIARGACSNPDAIIGGQHSWVVIGTDAYDPYATVIDPTIWSYSDTIDGLVITTMQDGEYHPHGWVEGMNMMAWGRPDTPHGDILELADNYEPSARASLFIDMLGPLDWQGWSIMLSQAPITGWPAGEITAAAENTPALSPIIPIDRLGMLTNTNPNNLYIAKEREGEHPEFREIT